jgi:23S rRNA pseudouridine2604 synthase
MVFLQSVAIGNLFPCHRLVSCRRFSSQVWLTKRMSELNLCSRREADRWIRAGLVSVNGKVAGIAEKVDERLSANSIAISRDDEETASLLSTETNVTKAVVVNKPTGYVSGQAEHGHQPAIRLLTRSRLWDKSDEAVDLLPNNSWKHFAPAGRLDLDSTGLLVFARAGVIAKKLIHHNSNIEKEYVVDVVPAVQETRMELELDPRFRLPPPSLDLSPISRGGGILLGEHRPLEPCRVEWLEKGTRLRIVLKEGRKQQIRRACRQLLGYHVMALDRRRIGPIKLGNLPQGCWRPLSHHEIQAILKS